MSFSLPPVVKLAERLLVDIEFAVSRFNRSFRNGYGTDLREQAYQVTLTAHSAWRDRTNQAQWLEKLVADVDGLKLRLQIGSRLHAFSSFGKFEELARTASELGRQTGGWYKRNHPKDQNGQHRNAGQPNCFATEIAA